MSQVSSLDKSMCDSESQMSTSDKSSTDPIANTTDNRSHKEKSQIYATNMSVVEEKPQVNAAIDESLGDLESQTSPSDKSEEKDPQMHTIESSDGLQSQKSTISKETSHAGATDEKLHVRSTDKSNEEVSSTGTTDKPVDQKSLVGNTYHAIEQVSQDSTVGSGMSESQTSFREQILIDPTEKSGEQKPPTSATDHSDVQKSPMVIHDKSDGQQLPTVTADHSDVQKSPMVIHDKSDGQQLPTVTEDHSNVQKSPMVSQDKCDYQQPPESIIDQQDKQDSPVVTTEKSNEQEPPTSITEMSGNKSERESCVSTAYHSSGQISENSTIGSLYEQKLQTADNQLKQRHVTHSGAGSRSPPHSKEPAIKVQPTTQNHWLIGGFIVSAVVMVVVYFLCSCDGQPPVHQESILEKFAKEFASLKKDFPDQNVGLWFRSEKLLQKHLNTSDPSTPSILILTAAKDGERTLRCVSQRLAKSYATSLDARWLLIDGPSMSEYDSATSKMQIDEALNSGFQSDSRAAVLYRLETLPSGSLLILYKYCDHENAAFKKVALVLTVLLDDQSLETDLSFTEVEEKVKDFLWERFAHSEVSAHNEMDVDKLSGVWSRISHVVLPVQPVESVETSRCPGITD